LYYAFPKHGNCDRDNDEAGPVNQLSRWTFDPATKMIDHASKIVLLDTPSTAKPMHNSGMIEFGKDGYVYITIGDTGSEDEAQKVHSLLGGMVCLMDTGDIPPDNPFTNDPEGIHCP